VLDEPAAHLDSGTADALAADVLAVDDDRSVVWVTHGRAGLDRVDRVLRLGDREAPPPYEHEPSAVLAPPTGEW
jgi:ATP-binding cassette subfamily C protein CydCD